MDNLDENHFFVLPYRQALGDLNWDLTDTETWLLWLPFIAGYGWSLWRNIRLNKLEEDRLQL